MRTLTALPRAERKTAPLLLGVVAHPDDEVLCMPALLLHARRQGWDTALLVLADTVAWNAEPSPDAGTDSECSSKRTQPTDVLAGQSGPCLDTDTTRHEELQACARLLGARVLSGGLPDGGVTSESARETIARALSTLRPDLVASMDLDGMYGHRDHVATTRGLLLACATLQRPPGVALRVAIPERVGRVRRALKRRHPELIDAEAVRQRAALDDERALTLDIDAEVEATLLAALACHRSQLPSEDPRSFLGGGVFAAPLPPERWRLGSLAGEAP